MDRSAAANQAIDNAKAQQDQFVSGLVSTGLTAAVGGPKKSSDIRLKENINKTGISKSGIPIYTFNYKNDNQLWSGTMAQDLLNIGRNDAVTIMDNGYYAVYYDMIDVDMIAKN